MSGSRHEGPQHSQSFLAFFFKLNQKKRWTEVKGTHEHLYVVAKPSPATDENCHVGLCVFIYLCVPSVNRKATDLSLQIMPLILQLHLSPPVAQKSLLFAYSSSTHRQKRGSRGEAHGGLKLSVFKGVGTPNFCLIHITPQRWSISRLQQERWAISWRDIAQEDAQSLAQHTQIHMHTISSTFRARWEGGIVPVGQPRVWLHLNLLLLDWLLGFDPTLPPEKAEKTKRVKEGKREKQQEMKTVREAGREQRKGKPPHPSALPDTDL